MPPSPHNLQASYAGEFIGRAVAGGLLDGRTCEVALDAGLTMYSGESLRKSFILGFRRGMSGWTGEPTRYASAMIEQAEKGKAS
jgi:hypothetical protein